MATLEMVSVLTKAFAVLVSVIVEAQVSIATELEHVVMVLLETEFVATRHSVAPSLATVDLEKPIAAETLHLRLVLAGTGKLEMDYVPTPIFAAPKQATVERENYTVLQILPQQRGRVEMATKVTAFVPTLTSAALTRDIVGRPMLTATTTPPAGHVEAAMLEMEGVKTRQIAVPRQVFVATPQRIAAIRRRLPRHQTTVPPHCRLANMSPAPPLDRPTSHQSPALLLVQSLCAQRYVSLLLRLSLILLLG